MRKDISAAEEGIQTSKFRSRGIQVYPVKEEREQNLLSCTSFEPSKFIPNWDVGTSNFFFVFGDQLRGVVSLKPTPWLA